MSVRRLLIIAWNDEGQDAALPVDGPLNWLLLRPPTVGDLRPEAFKPVRIERIVIENGDGSDYLYFPPIPEPEEKKP